MSRGAGESRTDRGRSGDLRRQSAGMTGAREQRMRSETVDYHDYDLRRVSQIELFVAANQSGEATRHHIGKAESMLRSGR